MEVWLVMVDRWDGGDGILVSVAAVCSNEKAAQRKEAAFKAAEAEHKSWDSPRYWVEGPVKVED